MQYSNSIVQTLIRDSVTESNIITRTSYFPNYYKSTIVGCMLIGLGVICVLASGIRVLKCSLYSLPNSVIYNIMKSLNLEFSVNSNKMQVLIS